MLLGARQFFEHRGAPTPPLPYDAEVEYLESTGTQYINTGIVPTIDTSCVLDYMDVTFVGWGVILGSATSDNNADSWYLRTNGNSSQPGFSFRIDGKSADQQIVVPLGTRVLCIASKDSFSVNDVTKIIGATAYSSTPTLPMYLFACNLNGSPWPVRLCKGRVYSLKIYQGSVLVRDFIPVRVGQVGYMYDRVSGALFRNTGTGAFTIGPDKTSWTNPYVTDGLVAMWDGEWNAGSGVHDASATVWANLAGTSTLPDLSISEGLSFSRDSLVFPYGAAYRDSKASASTGYAPSGYGYTLEIVIRNASANDSNRNALIFGCNTYQISTISRSSAGGQYSFGYNIEGIYSADTSYLASTWANNTATMYSNGAVGTPSTYKGTFGIAGIHGVCAINPRGDYPFVGEVCALRLYSRALTAEEIAANYAIDKARFNLP